MKEILNQLKKKWPKPIPKEVAKLFETAQKNFKGSKKRKFFHFIDSIHEVLKSHDLLFLSRQLTYHVVTMSDLPNAFGTKEESLSVLTKLLTLSVKQAVFGSKLEIQVKKLNLKEGPFIETRFIYGGKMLADLDRLQMLEGFYGKAADKEGTFDLAVLKNSLRRLGGQLWIEFPKENVVVLAFYWPAFDALSVGKPVYTGTYKYDMTLLNYSKIRQSFGVERAKKLVRLIENFVKSLVRYPVDMVVSFPEQGMISTIYESQEEAASSVATRIAGRLKKEGFRLGKKSVTPHFRYQLTFLA